MNRYVCSAPGTSCGLSTRSARADSQLLAWAQSSQLAVQQSPGGTELSAVPQTHQLSAHVCSTTNAIPCSCGDPQPLFARLGSSEPPSCRPLLPSRPFCTPYSPHWEYMLLNASTNIY